MTSLIDTTVVLDAGQLRVTLIRHRDRWRQRVSKLEPVPANPTLLLASLEGDAHDRWPASPALQSLHVESRPRGKVAMLVGMAGDSHWSASVELDEAHQRAVFDVACRAGSKPDFLGSSYEQVGELGRVTILEVPGSTAVVENDGAGQFRIVVTPHAQIWPQTVRWRYAIELARA